MKAQDTSELFFDEVRVPASAMLGEEGKGFEIDFELYLPEDWTDDSERREPCKIPHDVVFKAWPFPRRASRSEPCGAACW